MAGKSESPISLKKLTTRYSRVEDRIRMDAQIEPGNSQGFWLTQRLCRELVRTLVEYFNNSSLAYGNSSPQSQGEVQRFLHESARVTRKKTAPVLARPESEAPWLLDRVQIRTTSKAVQFLLPMPGGQKGSIAFSPNEARQWLDILYQQYRIAEWPLDIWPRWIQGKGDSQADSTNVRRNPVH